MSGNALSTNLVPKQLGVCTGLMEAGAQACVVNELMAVYHLAESKVGEERCTSQFFRINSQVEIRRCSPVTLKRSSPFLLAHSPKQAKISPCI